MLYLGIAFGVFLLAVITAFIVESKKTEKQPQKNKKGVTFRWRKEPTEE